MDKEAALTPTQASERIASLDVIRGAAILGLLLVNVTIFGLPVTLFTYDPDIYGSEGPNLWSWIMFSLFFEGTQRGLFTLLFGAGVVLFTQRMEASQHPNATDLYFRRYLWLLVFGIVHGFLLLWVGEVLYHYGVAALFLYAFRKAPPKTLIAIALGGLAFNAALNQLDTYHAQQKLDNWRSAVAAQQAGEALSSQQTEAIETWNKFVEERKTDAQEIKESVEGHTGSYFEQMVHQMPTRNYLQSSWFYRHFFDIFSMMLMGMAMFKGGLFKAGRPRKIYWSMVLIGYGIGLSINILEVRHLIANNFSALAQVQAGAVSGLSYDIARLAMTIGHVGVLMLLCSAPILLGLKRRLAAVGQTALSNYVSHSIICGALFYGIGFGLYGQLQPYQLYYVVVAVWAFQLIVSPIWLKHFRYGPLEWLWRSLTYGKRQPMRRRGAETVSAPQPL